MPSIGIVAGEASGDFLGADLISVLRKRRPDLQVTGIGGDRMRQAGCECLYPVEKLSVMGITEVLGRYLELHEIRGKLIKFFIANPPDVFIGIDAPDFNFPLELALRGKGIRSIHYVSPSIWAWREYRLKSIAKSVDMMLTLFPFEPGYYEKAGIPVRFVGHPLARSINLVPDPAAARRRLGLPEAGPVIALMPGSRQSELRRLTPVFLKTAVWCRQQTGKLHFISNLVNETDRQYVEQQMREITPAINVTLTTGRPLEVMEAADVVLLASGTAALEAMLLKRPMVVAYQLNWLTYQIAKRLIRVPYVSLPNLLAGKPLVPECLQDDCRPEVLGQHILDWLNNPSKVRQLVQEFTSIHEQIRLEGDDALANAVLEFIHA